MSRASRTRPVYIHFVEEDDLVRDLCRSGNYDQALKNINKRKLKKDPQNMYFMLVKACLLFCKNDVETSHSICLELLPPNMGGAFASCEFRNISCLDHLYYDSAIKLGMLDRSKLIPLWKAAIEAKPSVKDKEQWAKDWIAPLIRRCDWNTVDQATKFLSTQVLGNESTKARYHFWRVVALWLSKPQGPNADDPRFQKIGRQMALKMLGNSANRTRINGQLSPPISKPSEYDLMIELYLKENLGKELRILMESTMLQEKASQTEEISQQELRWKYSKRLPVDQFWEPNQRILRLETPGKFRYREDDYDQWLGLIYSAKTEEQKEIRADLIDKALDCNHKLRGVRMASMKVERGKPLVSMLSQYFADFGYLNSCEKDVTHLVDQLNPKEVSDLSVEMDSMHQDAPPDHEQEWQESMNRQTSLLHIRWQLQSRLDLRDDRESRTEALNNFIRNCLRLYQIAYDERLILLIFRALLHRYDLSRQPHDLIQALCFLSGVISRWFHDTSVPAALILINRFYGFSNIALEGYGLLKIKGIMLHTCAPLFFTRAGLMQPWTMNNQDERSGVSELQDSLAFFDHEPLNIARYQIMALEKDNYVQAIQFEELRSMITTSATKRLLRAERSAMSWFNDDPKPSGDLPPPDFQELPSIISASRYELPVLDELDMTPSYLHYIEYMSHVVEVCLDKRTFTPTQSEWFLKKRKLAHAGKFNLLKVEQASLDVIDWLVEILSANNDKHLASEVDGLHHALDELESLVPLDETAAKISPGKLPMGADYIAIYTAFWLNCACCNFCHRIKAYNKSKPPRLFNERVDSLCENAPRRLERVTRSAIRLSESWVSALEETRAEKISLFFGPQGERDEGVDSEKDIGKTIMQNILGETNIMAITDKIVGFALAEMSKIKRLEMVADNLLFSLARKEGRK